MSKLVRNMLLKRCNIDIEKNEKFIRYIAQEIAREIQYLYGRN